MGEHAPGIRDMAAAMTAAHHVLLSHGLALPVLRRNAPRAEHGIVLNPSEIVAASPSRADAAATRLADGLRNRLFLDPLFGRGYPADIVAWAGEQHGVTFDFVQPGDLEAIAAPLDFLGVNYYNREIVRDGSAAHNLPPAVVASGHEQTEMGWEVHAPAFYNLLCRLHFDYRPARLYVTENGASYSDGPDGQGRIADERRRRYIRDYLAEVAHAIEAGAPVAGYFVWSFLDNFEWARGYSQRFGIVWVDFATQRRLPKDSARWYSGVIARNGFDMT
jgi:beta-glucosidase